MLQICLFVRRIYAYIVDDDISPSAGSKPNPKFGLKTRVPFPPPPRVALWFINGPWLSSSHVNTA